MLARNSRPCWSSKKIDNVLYSRCSWLSLCFHSPFGGFIFWRRKKIVLHICWPARRYSPRCWIILSHTVFVFFDFVRDVWWQSCLFVLYSFYRYRSWETVTSEIEDRLQVDSSVQTGKAETPQNFWMLMHAQYSLCYPTCKLLSSPRNHCALCWFRRDWRCVVKLSWY
jgi:hypothetical protein